MPDKLTKVRMAYMGQRLTTRDTLAYGWAEVDENNKPISGTSGVWKKLLVSYAGIGTVWTFTRNEEGSIFTAGEHAPTRIKDAWVPDDLKIEWEATDADHRVDHERMAIAKREKDVSLIREALLPIRVAAHRRASLRRHALWSAVGAELARPLTAAEKKEAGL